MTYSFSPDVTHLFTVLKFMKKLTSIAYEKWQNLEIIIASIWLIETDTKQMNKLFKHSFFPIPLAIKIKRKQLCDFLHSNLCDCVYIKDRIEGLITFSSYFSF